MLEEVRSIRVMMYLPHCWGLVGCISSYRKRRERERERERERDIGTDIVILARLYIYPSVLW